MAHTVSMDIKLGELDGHSMTNMQVASLTNQALVIFAVCTEALSCITTAKLVFPPSCSTIFNRKSCSEGSTCSMYPVAVIFPQFSFSQSSNGVFPDPLVTLHTMHDVNFLNLKVRQSASNSSSARQVTHVRRAPPTCIADSSVKMIFDQSSTFQS